MILRRVLHSPAAVDLGDWQPGLTDAFDDRGQRRYDDI
jgi:hypothetical protein